MSSAILTQGVGTFGGSSCIPTLGFACATATRSTSCITACTVGAPKNNRITVFNGVLHHKNNGENQTASEEHVANELGNKFDDPRYYGREL
jgi:hypothetical protein